MEVEISRLVKRGTCFGRTLFISSGILMVAGKYLNCFFEINEESLIVQKSNVYEIVKYRESAKIHQVEF